MQLVGLKIGLYLSQFFIVRLTKFSYLGADLNSELCTLRKELDVKKNLNLQPAFSHTTQVVDCSHNEWFVSDNSMPPRADGAYPSGRVRRGSVRARTRVCRLLCKYPINQSISLFNQSISLFTRIFITSSLPAVLLT